MEIRKRFKKFGGTFIPDIVEYLKDCIEKDPYITISLGCDSIQRRRKTIYAITLMIYNPEIKHGAHVVFFRENVSKIRDNFDRLSKEGQYVQEIGEYLNNELEGHYVRRDLSLIERKKYKFHVAKCNGEYSHVNYNEDDVINSIFLSEHEKTQDYKLIDLHLDFNPNEGNTMTSSDGRKFVKNKSNVSYKAWVPGLRGMGYRVWAKPAGFAATSAADLLLKD